MMEYAVFATAWSSRGREIFDYIRRMDNPDSIGTDAEKIRTLREMVAKADMLDATLRRNQEKP